MNPRRPKEELDRLAVAAVSLQRVAGLSVVEIGEELRGRGDRVGDQRDVRFLLDRAKKLVNIVVEPVAIAPELDSRLGEELAAVTKVRRVLVVKYEACGRERSSSGEAPSPSPIPASTTLHRCLGAAAAIHLAEVLRDNDKIAVGPGRAVTSTIRALSDGNHGLAVNGLSVSSLGGGMMRTPFAPPDGIDLVDADYNAAQLAIALGIPVARVKLCYLPAFAPADRCDELVALLAPHLKDLDANVLLYGCGVIDENHYLLRMEDPQTQVIRAQAERLRALTQGHGCGVVIDFCDEFFAAPGVPADVEVEVRGIVAALRKAAVRIVPDQLARPLERILVAGGQRKLQALALLTDTSWKGPRPTTLVTDDATASALVATRRARGRRGLLSRGWPRAGR
jgi:DNA-binding transcriptional regulator LsrR (DeoR family)